MRKRPARRPIRRYPEEEKQQVSDIYPANQRWFHRWWRPAISWLFFVILAVDFIVMPLIWEAVNVMQNTHTQWVPMTSQGAGMFYVMMLGILGIYSFGRTQEKLAMFRDPHIGSSVIRHELEQERGSRIYDDPDLSDPLP